MSDYTDLCARLRAYVSGADGLSLRDEIADALESQAREIAELTEREKMLEAAVADPVDAESILGKLGSKLADLLDEDDWANVEPYLNRALLENYALRARAEAAEGLLREATRRAQNHEYLCASDHGNVTRLCNCGLNDLRARVAAALGEKP